MYNKGSSNSLSSNSSSANTATSTTAAASTTTAIVSNNGAGSTDRIEWSRATILDFIEDYRRQRVLWDPNTKGYHIKQTKYEALKSLGQKYGAEIRSIRSKIKSLRSSFHREHGKVINGRRKGLNYQPMWFAYDAIRFILDGETGDSDDAEGQKNDTIDSIGESSNNNNNNNTISLMAWNGHPTEEELMEERKISSRDIEHFNNHFLALGLQARHPMAMLAAVEAAAAASALSAAQEKRQELDYALKQQQQHLDKDDKHEVSSAPQLKVIELSSTSNKNNSTSSNSNNNNVNLTSTLSSSSNAATLNPISKPFASPKPSSPLTVDPTTTTATTPPPAPQPPLSALVATPQSQSQPQPSSTTTCSPENFSVLHGSRSLDENSAAIGNAAAATAISSLPITAVVSNSKYIVL